MKKSKKFAIVLDSILILATLCFIWGNSILSKTQSSAGSGKLFLKFQPFFDRVFGEGVITHNIFRKITHFCEFGLLGIEVFVLHALLHKIKPVNLILVLIYGLAVASVDEIIQIFSNRGARVFDVLIDFWGFTTAVLVLTLFTLIIRKIKTRKS